MKTTSTELIIVRLNHRCNWAIQFLRIAFIFSFSLFSFSLERRPAMNFPNQGSCCLLSLLSYGFLWLLA